ncbi:hypothetical protein ACFL1W_01440 [Candidatus Margulisiibacteriota bacterium]
MKNKFLLTGVTVLLLVCLQAVVSAADKTFFIKGTGITKLGTPVNAGNDDIKFYKNGSPLTLNWPGTTTPVTDFNISGGAVDDLGSPAGRNVQIDCRVGDSIGVTVWEDRVGAGGYYGKKTLSMAQANFDDSALTWNWTGLAVDYKAEAPYQPTISRFEEATTSYTDGRASSSSLRVYSAPGSGTDGLREITGYAWKMWPAADSEPSTAISGATSASLSLDSSAVTSGVAYSFKVKHANEWGETWSAAYDYTVAGGPGAAAGAGPITYNLTKNEGGLGLNAVAAVHEVPFNVDSDPVWNVRTIRDLVAAINAKSETANNVTTIGWMESSEMAGFYVTYAGDGTPSFVPTTGLDATADLVLERGKSYQISVFENVTVTFSQ